MDYEQIRFEMGEGVATVTLNEKRPPRWTLRPSADVPDIERFR
jgi:hypothetical protein